MGTSFLGRDFGGVRKTIQMHFKMRRVGVYGALHGKAHKQDLQPGAWTALSLKLFTVENGKHPQREGGTSIQAGFNS